MTDFLLRPPRLPEPWADDTTVADRARSELGPLLKVLDQPHVHVLVTRGVAALHGDVTDLASGAAIEARVLAVPGVRGIQSHLHVGLLPSDTLPSVGRTRERSPLMTQLSHAAEQSGFLVRAEQRYALTGTLGVLSLLLPEPTRARFLEHLPADVRRLARPPRWLGELDDIRRERDLAQTVAIAAGTDRTYADTLVRRVLPILRRHAPCDADVISTALPAEVAAIWAEVADRVAATTATTSPRS